MLTFHIFASSELFLGHNFFHMLLYIYLLVLLLAFLKHLFFV